MNQKTDKNNLTTRGQTFIGKVVRISLQKNAHVVWERRFFIPKYERYEKRRTKIIAHIPDNITHLNVGDVVEIKETRKISKTKNFIITKVMGR
ncbi:30S ribosomal protein S17 [Candidatus Woesearchaeota archaeon]|nr:30S ribosomal protein S17 [Candidatus Woesearchaeota archaeon]